MLNDKKAALKRWKNVKRQFSNLGNKRLELSDFLSQASQIDPEIAIALGGIYCGENGETRAELPGRNSMACFGWYQKKVEFAYVS